MKNNPFGEDALPSPRRTNPFGEDLDTEPVAEAAERLDHAARKIRGLRTQLGAEGLTLSGTRELIDELSAALESAARALRGLA